jgi:protein tyrosine phosphatase (PTP) superfamily phosphohydrolase (DUF442 family)
MIRFIDEDFAVAPQLAPEHMKQVTEVSAQTLRDALAEVPRPVLAFCRSGARSQLFDLAAKASTK